MLIKRTLTSIFHDNDTVMHHVNCVFINNVCLQYNKHNLFGNLAEICTLIHLSRLCAQSTG